MKNNFYISLLLGTIILCFVSLLIELPFGVNWDPNFIFWMFLSNFLITILLALLIKKNILNGIKLSVVIFLIYFIIGNFNILIEAYIFNVTDRNETIVLLLKGLVLAIIISPVFVFLFRKWKSDDTRLAFEPRSIFQWVWRIVVADLLYLVFYILAGFILYTVYPQLMDFYGDKVPDFSLMINTQFFRALLFIGIALIISRTVNASFFYNALLVGAVFSVIGGIAPLIVPGDEIMPAYIRFGHAFEVGISNFIYGFILTYLVGQKTISPEASNAVKKPVLKSQILLFFKFKS